MKYSVVAAALHFTRSMCHAFKWVSDDCCAVFGEEGSQVWGAPDGSIYGSSKIYWTNSVCCTFPSSRNLLLPSQAQLLLLLTALVVLSEGRAAHADALAYAVGRTEKTHHQQIEYWTEEGKEDMLTKFVSSVSHFWWDLFNNTICRDWIWQARHSYGLGQQHPQTFGRIWNGLTNGLGR